MFLNLLRFLLLILVFDITLSKTPNPSKNHSPKVPNLDNNYEELKELRRSENQKHPNGKSLKKYSNEEETKEKTEFLTLEDPIDNFSELKPNPIISNSEQDKINNLVSTGKGDFRLGNEFLCNNTSKNHFAKDSKLHPCNHPTRKDQRKHEKNLNHKHKKNPSVENVISNDSINEPDLDERNSESNKGNAYIERSLKFMNNTIEKAESQSVRSRGNNVPFDDESSGPPSDGRIPLKHHASHKWNRPMKGTFKSDGTHYDNSKKKISRIDKVVINQQSKITKTIKSRGGNKRNKESGRTRDDPSPSNVGPQTITTSSQATMLEKDAPSKHAEVTTVKEHDVGENNTVETVSDIRENSNKTPDTTTKDPLNLKRVHIYGKDGNDHEDWSFVADVSLRSKGVSHTKKNKLDKPPVKHPQHEVKLSRSERIPEEDRVYFRKLSKRLTKEPWNSGLDQVSGESGTDSNDFNAENIPTSNSENSRDVSHAEEKEPEDGETSYEQHNKEKHSKMPKDDAKVNSHHKIKVLSEDLVAMKVGYLQDDGGADANSHKERKPPFPADSGGSKDTFRAKEDRPHESFQNAVEQLSNNERIPDYDKATNSRTPDSLSESLKVLFYNQSLYQEIMHLVKTDRNVQAYVFNVLLLYVPVLICDVLLWLVILKLLRHIHRQFVSNRLNSASSMPEKQEMDTEGENSSPRETSCPNQSNKEASDKIVNSEVNAPSGDVWYPPK